MPHRAPPPGATITFSQQFRRCGKKSCSLCVSGTKGHGPYWYKRWQEGGQTRSQYVGRTSPQASRLPVLRVRTLGGFGVWRGEMLIQPELWSRRKVTLLFKCLLSAPGHRVTRDELGDWLWPEADMAAVDRNLRITVHRLQAILHGHTTVKAKHSQQQRVAQPYVYLRSVGGVLSLAYTIDDQSLVWLDSTAFAHAADTALAQRDAAACRSALGLYGGDYLPDDRFEEWATARREQLRDTYVAVLLHLADLCATQGEAEQAIHCIRTVLTIDPCHEQATNSLMGLLATDGQRAAALRAYQALVVAMRRELDLPPGPKTEALARALLSGNERLSGGLSASSTPVTTLLIGRQRERAYLAEALHVSRDGRGQVILLTGETGIGKTRLVEEAAVAASELGFTVLWGHSCEGCHQMPYLPIVLALRAYVNGKSPELLRYELEGAEDLAAILPELLAAPVGLAPPPLADPQRLWTAVFSLLVTVCSASPVMLILEDLHWADEPTLDCFKYLLRHTRELRLCLLGTMGEEHMPADHTLHRLSLEAAQSEDLRLLPLGPLSLEDVGSLTRQKVGQAIAPPQVQALYSRSSGNPFFIGMLLALIRERKPEGNTFDAALSSESTTIDNMPRTLYQAIRQRIGLLPAACYALLRAGAVLDDRFDECLLAHIVDQQEHTFKLSLDLAVRVGMLQKDRTTPGKKLRWSHPLLRRTLYDDILPGERQRLHELVGSALSDQTFCGSVSPVELIAYHYARSDNHVAATLWLERAGDWAMDLHAYKIALTHYSAAQVRLEAWEADWSLSMRLQAKLANTYALLGNHVAPVTTFSTPLAHITAIQSPERTALGHRHEEIRQYRSGYDEAIAGDTVADHNGRPDSNTSVPGTGPMTLMDLLGTNKAPTVADPIFFRREFAQAEETHRRDVATWQRNESRQWIATAWLNLGLVAYIAGDLSRADDRLLRSLAIAQRIGHQWGVAWAWTYLGQVAYAQGDYHRAGDCHRQGIAVFQRIDHQRGIAISYYHLGRIAYECADRTPMGFLGANVFNRRARRLSRNYNIPEIFGLTLLLQVRIWIHPSYGRQPSARRQRVAQRCIEYAQTLADTHGLADLSQATVALRALHFLTQGDIPKAKAAALEAFRLAIGRQRRWQEAEARRLIGLCALACGEIHDGETHLRSSLILFTEMGAAVEGARLQAIIAGLSGAQDQQAIHNLQVESGKLR